jgi:hypothetical protein
LRLITSTSTPTRSFTQDECPQAPEVRSSQSSLTFLDANCIVLVSFRRFPQLDQGEIFSLQDAFRRLDVDDRGYLDEASVIKATQQSERQPYDVVRQALKGVELDSSRRVELEDYIDVSGRVLIAPFGVIISRIWSLGTNKLIAGFATPHRTGSWCCERREPRGCD